MLNEASPNPMAPSYLPPTPSAHPHSPYPMAPAGADSIETVEVPRVVAIIVTVASVLIVVGAILGGCIAC